MPLSAVRRVNRRCAGNKANSGRLRERRFHRFPGLRPGQAERPAVRSAQLALFARFAASGKSFAFIGQFAETPRDTIFTTEYSMRTGMESVYTLLDIDRGVPEVWGSKYDVRELLRACYYAIDKKPITDIKLSFKEKMLLKVVMKKAKGTDVELLVKESGLIE